MLAENNLFRLTKACFAAVNSSRILLKSRNASLGNHEFDEEVNGVVPFIRNLSSPIVTANLLLKNVPELKDIPNLYDSIVINKNGIQIGIIGYLTPETKFLAIKNNVEYEDEIIAINREVKKLKELGIQILIALGHSGYLKDLEIAEHVDDIDLVIGAHSHTFLSNQSNTNEIPEIIQGPYPTLVKQKSGRNVLVVQAYAYTKYLGKLYLLFDATGEIVRYDGGPMLLNKDVPEDPDMLKLIEWYQKDMDFISKEVIGNSLVFLDGDSCRLRECNMGNFINDAVINYTKKYHKESSNAYIALIQGGRIRASIIHPENPFNVTRGDLMTVLPFSDSLCIITMNGTVLMQALEHSVDSWRTVDTPGQFLQFSGVKVVYDLTRKPGSRVVNATALCSTCSELTNIKDFYEYKIITSLFIADGGDNYTMFEKLRRDVVSYSEIDCTLTYLREYSPIQPVLSNRIIILKEDKIQPILNRHSIDHNTKTNINSSSVSINVNLIIYLLAIIFIYKCK